MICFGHKVSSWIPVKNTNSQEDKGATANLISFPCETLKTRTALWNSGHFMQNTTSYGHRKNSTIIKLELLLTKLRVQSPKSCLPLIEIENHNNNKAPSPNHFLITCRINTSWPTKSLQKGLCYICVYYSESRNLALQRDDSNGVRIVTIGQYERFQSRVRRCILSMRGFWQKIDTKQ